MNQALEFQKGKFKVHLVWWILGKMVKKRERERERERERIGRERNLLGCLVRWVCRTKTSRV